MGLLIGINPLYYSVQKSGKKAKTTLSKSKESASVPAKVITVKKPVIFLYDSDGGPDGVMYAFVHTSLYHTLINSLTIGLTIHLSLVLMIVLMKRRQLHSRLPSIKPHWMLLQRKMLLLGRRFWNLSCRQWLIWRVTTRMLSWNGLLHPLQGICYFK